MLNLQLFSRQNHNLASISPLNLLHVSADLTLVECYMDWFLWIHALMLLKLAVKCCDGWGTSCASTKIGLGNITQTITYFLNQHRIDRASPPMKQATLLNILVCHERSFYWISEPAYSLQQKEKKDLQVFSFQCPSSSMYDQSQAYICRRKKNCLLVCCVHCSVIFKPIHKIIQMGFSVHKMVHQLKSSGGY